jgi:threonine/homoserine/homoserine lactone efflux protein
MPQFVTADASNALLHMVGLSAVFMLMTLVIFVVYRRFAAAVRNQVISRPARLDLAAPCIRRRVRRPRRAPGVCRAQR